MKTILTTILALSFIACASVNPDTYKKIGSSYGRDDGWYTDSSNNAHLIINGSSVASFSSTGALDSAGGDITLENDAVISNGTDNAVDITENSEDFVLTFGTNDIAVTSSTGVTEFDFGTINLETDEIDANGTGTLTLLVNSEDLVFTGSANDMAVSSSTGVTEVDFGTINLETDEIDANGTGTLTVLVNSEDMVLTGATNELQISTGTGVTRHDYGAIGLKTDTPLFMVKTSYFCGNGANATTSVYMPPVIPGTEAADGSTYEYGEAGCDGLDNTTETSGDDFIQGNGAIDIKVVGMACGISAAGTDDVYTFTLRDDTADVTGVTCNVTLDGAIQQCSVLLDAPVTMAAGSLAAVKSEAATDDNVSAADVECQVFYTY